MKKRVNASELLLKIDHEISLLKNTPPNEDSARRKEHIGELQREYNLLTGERYRPFEQREGFT